MDTNEAIQTARLMVLARYPYLSPLIHKLTIVEEAKCPTFAVDSALNVYYNPAFVTELAAGQDVKNIIPTLAGIMLHETMHILLRHRKRNKVINGIQPIDNVAMDLEINGVIIQDKVFPLPDQGCIPGKGMFKDYPSGLTFEEYYTLLMKDLNDAMKDMKVSVTAGDCGEGATGRKGGYEKGNGDKEDQGSSPSSGATDIAVEMAINSVAENIQKYPGNVHASLKRFAGDRLKPSVIRWQTVLRRKIQAAIERQRGYDESGYHRLSTKSWGLWANGDKVCLPSRYDTPINVAVGIDTSGSMGQAQLQSAISETQQIVRATGCSIRGFCIDTAVSGKVQEIDLGKLPDLSGGGGTDMGVACSFAMTMKPKPTILIILTDCYTPWPVSPPPGIRVIVCAIGNDHPTGVPTWADLVIAKDVEGS